MIAVSNLGLSSQSSECSDFLKLMAESVVGWMCRDLDGNRNCRALVLTG